MAPIGNLQISENWVGPGVPGGNEAPGAWFFFYI